MGRYFSNFWRGLVFQSDDNGGGNGGTPPAPPPDPGGGSTNNTPSNDDNPPASGDTTPETWQAFIDAQPEAVQKLYKSDMSGLRGALDNERDARKDLEKQLKALSGKLEEGSEARKQLDQLAADLETSNRRATFYDEAIKPEVGITDLKAAWLIIAHSDDEYLDRRGNVDFKRLKEVHPGLFKTPPPPAGHAGTGTQTPPPSNTSMDDYIRGKAGVKK